MEIYPIESGNFKLDGGAMFGVVPKKIWERTNPADSDNLIDVGMRCMLIADGKRLILVDTGLGYKQNDQFFSHFKRWGAASLKSSIEAYGFGLEDITDVFLTHLHFDHVGGAITSDKNGLLLPTFKNATYWSNQSHWDWATNPNPREKASFLSENILPIQQSGQLNFINSSPEKMISNSELNFGIFFADGHTEKQMLPMVQYQGKKIVFMADLLPTIGHIPLPYVMSYDTRPLLTLEEKSQFLELAAKEQFYLFLQHDAHHELCTVTQTEKGIRLDQTFAFNEIFTK